MKNRVTSWFARIKRIVNNLFTSRGYSFSKENDEFYKKTMKRFGEWNFSKKNLRDKQKILNEIADDGKDIQIIGIIDGYRGQNPGRMNRIVGNVAALWQSFIESTFTHELEIANSKREKIKSHYKNLKKRRRRLRKHQKAINSHYNLNSKNYSLILGLVYVTISILLIKADFPLSIDVVQQGFGIEKDKDSFDLALGIVLITIYFKIFYDEYLGTSILKTLLNGKRENILGEGNNADDAEISEAKRIKRRRLIAKVSILTLLVVTLYYMGEFRSDYMGIDPNDGSKSAVANKPAYYEIMKSTTTKHLFILLSIMFPVIGGICASIGVNMLQNKFDRIRIWTHLLILQRRIAHAKNHLSVARGIVKTCQNNVKWVSPEGNFTEDCTAYFFSYYLHGYEWGMRIQMPDEFYEVAEHARTHEAKINATETYFAQMIKSANNLNFNRQHNTINETL